MGINYVSEGGPDPSEKDASKIPCPEGLVGESEQSAYRGSFLMGALKAGATTKMGLSREIADLARKLGLER